MAENVLEPLNRERDLISRTYEEVLTCSEKNARGGKILLTGRMP